MKKLFVPIILFALTGMLMSSCSNTSKLAFNERHYRSGSFINAAGKNHTVTFPVAIIPVRTKDAIPAIAIAKSEISVITLQKPDIAQKKMRESYPIIITSNSTKQALNQTVHVTEGPAIESNQTHSDIIASQGDSGDGAAGAALSLLWIIIVVILILWLIGILAGGFGLGGLINLLLVIALILFILWLLRIW